MTEGTPDDGVMRLLAALPAINGNAQRSRQLRARCRATLDSRQQKPAFTSRVWPALVALLCAAYLAQLARIAVATAFPRL